MLLTPSEDIQRDQNLKQRLKTADTRGRGRMEEQHKVENILMLVKLLQRHNHSSPYIPGDPQGWQDCLSVGLLCMASVGF